ncbi:hypothetical protein BKA83DRAFT_686211 [Pisolithus microcarpus]|nr:hypothetical protein BKA83DRAFT_686211 [Pisolithus microcarpus]
MSPFVRDIGQILLDNGSTLRELWAGMNVPKDENGGGGSGMTSRHHSISVVQPQRPTIVGFNASGHDTQDKSAAGAHSCTFHAPSFGSGGFVLSNDNLPTDLGSLSLSKDRSGLLSSAHPLTQPSLLPIYAPISRSPLSSDWISPYQCINLNIPTGTSFASHQRFGSLSDSGLSAGGSPPRSQHCNNGHGSQQQQQQQQQQSSLTAHFIPRKGIQVPSHPRCCPPQVIQSNLRRAAKACHCHLFQLCGHSTSSSLRPVAPIFST